MRRTGASAHRHGSGSELPALDLCAVHRGDQLRITWRRSDFVSGPDERGIARLGQIRDQLIRKRDAHFSDTVRAARLSEIIR